MTSPVAVRQRAAALQAFGFTPRQARFPVLVLEHSGVCLPRQYGAFAGIAHGRQTHRFFAKLIRGGFATTDLSAPAHAGRIFHLQYKPWYRALGEADHRHRKPVSVGRAVERGGARKTVSVAGYPRLEEGARVIVTLLAIPDAGSYQEISLRPASGKDGR